MKLLWLALVGVLMGGCAFLPEKPCSLRDKNLIRYHSYLLSVGGNATDGEVLANRFLILAIEKEVPAYCWRTP